MEINKLKLFLGLMLFGSNVNYVSFPYTLLQLFTNIATMLGALLICSSFKNKGD